MTRERWITLVVVSTATAMLLLDVTVVNVALPVIGADLGASFDELQGVIDAYALTLAATLLTASVLADRLGRRSRLRSIRLTTSPQRSSASRPATMATDVARFRSWLPAQPPLVAAKLPRLWTVARRPNAEPRSRSGARPATAACSAVSPSPACS
jgi:MFS family permease